MERILIKNLHDHIGKEISVSGSVEIRRDHGKLIFFELRDRTGLVQAVCLPGNPTLRETAEKARAEWVVSVRAMVQKRPEKMIKTDSPTGDIELVLSDMTILSSAHELPFEKDGDLNIDTHFDHLPLTLRTEKARALFTVQHRIIKAFRDFLTAEDFTEIQAPKLVGADAEGGAAAFEVDYFGKKAFLATSPQFYKQIMVGVFERVFATTSVYRAEKHSTTRHINEYTSLDLEFGFIKDHNDIMDLKERLLAYIIGELKKTSEKEFALWGATIPVMPSAIPRMKLREAQEIIKTHFGEDCTGEPDLEPQHERWLCEYSAREWGSDFVFVTHYPVSKRPFYTYEDEADPGYTKSFDLLFRGLEITTGGQRIHDYEKLKASIEKRGLDSDKFAFYLEAFKYGMPPEGGLATGLERITAKLLNIDNIKRATLFPRDMNRIDTLLG